MSYTLSPSMSLPIPGVGTEAGPQYAFDINACMTLIDGHTHAPGSGVPITPEAISINSALTFANNPATNVSYIGLMPQIVQPVTNAIYEFGSDLYYADAAGNQVRITANGGVAGTPGSIAGLTPPASVTYVSGSQTFVFQSNTSIAANLDAGAILLRNLSPNSTFALTLTAPNTLSSNYTITLPALPIDSSFMTINASGTVSTLTQSGGITGSMIASNTITPSNLTFSPTEVIQSFTSSGTLVVPALTTSIHIQGIGGGGGGGSGYQSDTSQPNISGGAGGASGYFGSINAPVTPGETITITIGGGGSGGPAALTGTGVSGSTGSDTTVTGTFGTYTFRGGRGGQGGVAGPSAVATSSAPALMGLTSSSGGQSSAVSNSGDAGSPSIKQSGGAAGATAATQVGGGGGGAGLGAPGVGGGNSPAQQATNGTLGSGGGGGYGLNGVVAVPSGAGGNGGGGQVTISYFKLA